MYASVCCLLQPCRCVGDPRQLWSPWHHGKGLGALLPHWPFGEEGEQRTCRTEFCEHSRDPRCTCRVNPGVKKDRDTRITGGMGRKDTKGEAEVCAKQLGAGELIAQSASCSWSCVCPAVHGLAPACAQQHCAEGQRSRHVSRSRWMERV